MSTGGQGAERVRRSGALVRHGAGRGRRGPEGAREGVGQSGAAERPGGQAGKRRADDDASTTLRSVVRDGHGLGRGREPEGGAGPDGGVHGPRDIGRGRTCKENEAKYSKNSFMAFPGSSESIWGENGRVSLEAGLASKVLRQ